MPKALIVGQSALLTESGWIGASSCARNAKIHGIDRHGKLATEVVSLERVPHRTPSIFLGTSLCCGVFSGNSRIADTAGRSHTLKQIVAACIVDELTLEATCSADPASGVIPSFDSVWDSLKHEAASTQADKVIIRHRSPKASKDESATLFQHIHLDGQQYAVLTKSALQESLAKDFVGSINEILVILTNEDGACEISRINALLILIIADSLQRRKCLYQLSYDSIQHTAAVFIELGGRVPGSISRGRCAHLIAGEEAIDQLELAWNVSSWNPLCNGVTLVSS